MSRGFDAEGFSLPEILIGLVIAGTVAATAISLVLTGLSAFAHHIHSLSAGEALRSPEVVLPSEIRTLVPGIDLAVPDAAVIELRAIRGSGLVCRTDAGRLHLRYTGIRRPDPVKDSALLIVPGGTEKVLPVVASGPGAGECGAATALIEVPTDDAVSEGTAVLIFERGSYHLEQSAFRYRRGMGGRQPLTAELLSDSESGFLLATPPGDPFPGTLFLEAELAAQTLPGGATPRRPRRLRIRMLNPPTAGAESGEEAGEFMISP